VGFLAPLSHDAARTYADEVLAAVPHQVTLWVAEEGDRVVGSVQLVPCRKDNGRHRAEVQKLQVLSTHQGRGLSGVLMRALEAHARATGLTLLHLDTIAGSRAESVYQHLGWRKSGEIPEYAAMPDGELRATAVYYKQLGT
jgi:GNAT superfamily N-acetyltransferase